ncbi:glycerol-3-phosphate responsive antiterminator [Anaerococcus sp. Marseille-P9784]|uniref:glycerol-3-phosphate responsive antiterminator n=1 Tax=Anaerococcus sp. Marseille-P9784 TaxID=2614127 RepID=UPI00124A46FC|nr:glycerol-3-phosphate responsive antiterminator [Anaerococcus sp. Marseille-P9784]
MSSISVLEELYDNPVIMAIKNNKDLHKCLESENRVVFVLYGNIETIPHIVKKLKDANKVVIVHEDLIEGLSSSNYAASFIKNYTQADGVISTRPSNVTYARKLGLFTILRFFLIDSISFENMKQTIKDVNCDAIEILPGVLPDQMKEVKKRTNIPLIAGGLIAKREEVINALNAGAIAISSSNYKVWLM